MLPISNFEFYRGLLYIKTPSNPHERVLKKLTHGIFLTVSERELKYRTSVFKQMKIKTLLGTIMCLINKRV